jgi:heme exporter protein D
LEALLNPHFPFDPSLATGVPPAYWGGPRYLAGDDGRAYDAVAESLCDLGWTNLAVVRGRREPSELPEDHQVLRSTVLHLSPDALRWAQWLLADEPFHLGGLPVAWQVSARSDARSPFAEWSAYFTSGVPGEVIADFLRVLDVYGQPEEALSSGPEMVLEAVTAHGWFRDADEPHAAAMHPTFTARLCLAEVPPLIQDGDPHALTAEADDPGARGWQAWVQLGEGASYLWAASFSASVPHGLVAAFAASLSSTAPVLRRVLPESTRDRLLRAAAD